MDAQSLALFVDIVEAGNLSAAARNLKMSRANVSYHLAQLEKSVGLQLMRRTTRRVELTEAGERLYRHGRVVRDEVLAAREAVASLGRGLHGSLRISLPTGFGHMVMSGWLIEFKREYPDIALDVLFDNRVDDLLRDEVDVAVRVMSEPPQQMVATELAEVRYVVCASAAYARSHPLPSTLDELAEVPLITSGVSGRDLRVSAYRGDARRQLTLHPTLASENFQFLREALLADLGVGLVPDYVVADEIGGRVVTALTDWRLSVFGTRMFLLRMPGRYQTLAARTLIEFVAGRAAKWRERFDADRSADGETEI
ncbi:LysR family transcriptional regulator [Bordetella genomosp. 9]|uniref:LysR family transcriptional regulator n=1 Tax=Bordetella genomosp. 9 TaxID=1416803 RepID=A0A261R1F3_9BORD|nr:LysR family transcriptional regulator [Bordetella genomosp. 9]OZI18826.1 LysR family transcriptional regulator [Bordetella genomosp. 9]